MPNIIIDNYKVSEELANRLLDLALDIEIDITSKHPDIPISIVREIVAHTFNSFAWQIHEIVKMEDEDEDPPAFIQ